MELVLPTPNEKQKLFLTARDRYVAFGGARGGGKSWAVRTKAILLALRWNGIKIMIVRRTYKELEENHIKPLCRTLHVYDPDKSKRLARYNDSKKVITFPNGSEILFMYCENDKDAERFQGTEVDVLFVDEATHQTEDRIKKLNACVRGVNNFPKRTYYTCNPGGVGHAWVKRLFIDRKFREGERGDDYRFIQSLVTDNKALMDAQPEYIQQLEALPPKIREAWLHGRWDLFEGQVFEEFVDSPEHYQDRRWTHVIEPFAIPENWKIYQGFDWGYSKPYSIGWYAIDYDGRAYRIREYYGCQIDGYSKEAIPDTGTKETVNEVAQHIHDVESTDPNLKGRRIYRFADPAIFAADQNGISIAETMEKQRIYFEKGDHNRIPGKMQCHYRLVFDENGVPMFYTFSTCQNFIRTIPLLIYDEKKVEDIDTTMEDHIYDEWRYVMMANPIAPRRRTAEGRLEIIQDDPLDLFKEEREQLLGSYNFMRML